MNKIYLPDYLIQFINENFNNTFFNGIINNIQMDNSINIDDFTIINFLYLINKNKLDINLDRCLILNEFQLELYKYKLKNDYITINNFNEYLKYNICDKNNNTVLIWLFINKKFDIFNDLLCNNTHEFNISQINNNNDTLFILLCKYKYCNFALTILNFYSEQCNLLHIDNYGNSAIFYICYFEIKILILKILELNLYNLSFYINKYNHTLLYFLCKNNIWFDIIYKLLDYQFYIDNLNYIDNIKNTIIMYLLMININIYLKNKYIIDNIFDKIFNYNPDFYKINHINNFGNTLFIYLCKNPYLNNFGIKLLNNYYDKLNLNQINKEGDNAFILSCKNNINNISLKLLDYYFLFNISHKNVCGKNAYIYAVDNNMIDVIHKINNINNIFL